MEAEEGKPNLTWKHGRDVEFWTTLRPYPYIREVYLERFTREGDSPVTIVRKVVVCSRVRRLGDGVGR